MTGSPGEMPFLDHLEELRQRILRSLGAVVVGFAIGLFETFWSAYLPIDARDIALYAALIAFLVLRPGGFLGMRDPTPRQV